MKNYNSERLSEKKEWDSRFSKLKLPRVINLINYNYYRFDKFYRDLFREKYKGSKFLEIGCGASAWLIYFSKQFGFKVSGVDYSKLGCDLAKENLRLNNITGKMRLIDS